jgi:hypothetical protein
VFDDSVEVASVEVTGDVADEGEVGMGYDDRVSGASGASGAERTGSACRS